MDFTKTTPRTVTIYYYTPTLFARQAQSILYKSMGGTIQEIYIACVLYHKGIYKSLLISHLPPPEDILDTLIVVPSFAFPFICSPWWIGNLVQMIGHPGEFPYMGIHARACRAPPPPVPSPLLVSPANHHSITHLSLTAA